MNDPCTLRIVGENLVLRGGPPSGREFVESVVTSWPGWKRTPSGSGDAGTYMAPLLPTAILPVASCTTLKIGWDQSAKDFLAACRRKLAVVTESLREPLNDLPTTWPTARTPMRHQLQALGALREMGWRALLADDMGLGKTSTALWAAWMAKARRLLVICPVAVKWNWEREIGATLDGWSTIVVDGTPNKRADQLAEHTFRDQSEVVDRHALILNYDQLTGMGDHALGILSGLVERGAFVILDESHYIKSMDAERTKVVRQHIVAHAKHLLLLSGTPMRNFASDLYPQVTAVQPGTWTDYKDFLDRHVQMRIIPRGRYRVSVPARNKRMAELNAVVSTVQVRRTKEVCEQMPEVMRTSPEIVLDATMRQVYAAMKTHARYEIDALIQDHGKDALIWEPTVRTGATTAMMRCEQVAQGFVGGIPEPLMERLSKVVTARAEKIVGRPGELVFPLAAKVVWLLEAIEAIKAQGGRPVVMSRFNGPMHWLKGKLAHLKVGFLHGGLAPADKDRTIAEFQAGETEVFLCQVRMAEGFNLTASSDLLFFGRDWSPAVNSQAEARLARIGQKGTVNVQVPIVRETVEVYLDKKLNMKQTDAESALATATLGELLNAL